MWKTFKKSFKNELKNQLSAKSVAHYTILLLFVISFEVLRAILNFNYERMTYLLVIILLWAYGRKS